MPRSFWIISLFFISLPLSAQTLGEQIGSTQQKIKLLEGEIAGYEKELTSIERARNTLANTLKTLNLTIKKLDAQSQLTQDKIEAAALSISQLSGQIDTHTQEIDKRVASIGESLRAMRASLDINVTEIMLSEKTISEKIDRIYTLTRLQDRVRQDLDRLKDERAQLSTNKTDLERTRAELVILRNRLSDQRKLQAQNKKDKEVLLIQTKNKEANYRTLLEQKITQKAQFEQELRSYEASLRQEIDLSKLPHPGSGVLAWPLDQVTITQYFGFTEFAKANAYNGKGHNGVDFRATMGTPIKAAAGGTVRATGNTDLGCPGGSYGQWLLIDHDNSLSTLYAHLSLVKVVAGESVQAGNLVGYSGQTGYATGPHLHFGVYATEGVKVTKLTKSDGTVSKCAEMPVAPLNAYLNPLIYL